MLFHENIKIINIETKEEINVNNENQIKHKKNSNGELDLDFLDIVITS